MRRAWIPSPVLGAVLLLQLGCAKDDVRTYSAPKDGPPAPATAESTAPPGSGMETVEWTLPAGWQERPGEGMRFATLLLGNATPPVELRVTPLALAARDPLANINRWREQIGLPDIGPAQLAQVARTLEIDGRSTQLIDMTGIAQGTEPARQILAAILLGDERAWFFLVMDTPDRAGPQAQGFEAFMRTVRVRPAALATNALPPGHPPLTTGEASAPAAGALPPAAMGDAPALDWQLPQGWIVDHDANPSRLATLHVGEGANRAEVTITRFPGDVGGLLPNINRWRGQIGLQPVTDLAQQPMQTLQVDGADAAMVDLIGPGTAGERARLLVVLVPRADFTYFVKMTGPEALVERERAAFTSFSGSLRFERGQS